ncbi:ribokinase [Kitasatospora xanthocidica]|uniref:PfkB family carbohydrate kinase n=1 Tax=Kitasatospora xanthocidica TaxID=83382 RepID=UPI001679211D|nr:PfkB family carbohydrate kinase [Kitasatospora xanthocidica]GHF81084.1 ribokinase [Kitasatospora xanthocidica]
MKLLPVGRVVVIGSVTTDRILRCPALPSPGGTVLADAAAQGFGGKGANQAVAAGQMGAATHLVAKIGRDAEGEAALADLRGAEVETGAVHTHPDAPTGQTIVLVDPAGENIVVVVPGANAYLTPEEVTAALARLHLLPVDVVLTSNEVPAECIRATAAALPAQGPSGGTRWLHDTAPAGALPGPGPTGRRPLVVANAAEAHRLTGVADVTAAALALADRAEGVVITLGGEGALVAADGRSHRLPAPAVRVVDTAGAGDVFRGALAAELARGAELPAAAATAVAAGAFAVTAPGARGALPRPTDL